MGGFTLSEAEYVFASSSVILGYIPLHLGTLGLLFPGRRRGPRPWRGDPVHPCIGNQLSHVFVVMNNDAQVHAVHGNSFPLDLNLALKIFRLQL